MSVLVTGFGPYQGPLNSTQELLRSLEERPLESLQRIPGGVHLRIFPVDTMALAGLFSEALEEVSPGRILLLGQAPGRGRVELELRARNLLQFSRPDVAGRILEGVPVIPGGPRERACTLRDPGGLRRSLEQAGIPAGLSLDAGLYLCNQLYYLALAQAGEGVEVGFVHLPVLPQQVPPDRPSMGLETLRRALEVLLLE
jgi:pyroglutamyl-peptidase